MSFFPSDVKTTKKAGEKGIGPAVWRPRLRRHGKPGDKKGRALSSRQDVFPYVKKKKNGPGKKKEP